MKALNKYKRRISELSFPLAFSPDATENSSLLIFAGDPSNYNLCSNSSHLFIDINLIKKAYSPLVVLIFSFSEVSSLKYIAVVFLRKQRARI